MEIIFLLVGFLFMAVGVAIVISEVRSRIGTERFDARVIGFSTGKTKKSGGHSFHSIAEYIGPNGRKYYVEGSVGSSVPLHAVGDSVTILANPLQPESAVLKSALSFILGFILALMGLACAAVFWFTFHANVYSAVMAAVVVGAVVLKIKNLWRKQPLSLQMWQEYKKQILSPKVFTDESKDQISWADPMSVAAAIGTYQKTSSVSIPLLFVIGLGCLFFSHRFYQKTNAFLERASPAAGRVIDLKATDSADASTTYAPIIEFSDGRGQSHTFVDSFSSSPPSYYTGQSVRVLYNRENPREAQIDRGRANYWLAILLGSLGVLFTSLGIFTTRTRARRRFAET